ncbi:DUF6233 domain-containing protein [Streptomyces cylindrosporus]|uniref:DUF6233 domain-containing protein n=1 Tax=Streptomyces cylindrosporus TaxID=2927583 RepID=A0ABS9YPK0_9ACTN|nr:DUF6233 domain-containing protein [Streptomyces cylindrosporus]MCI3279202.1 DUF6233 domain-containing protein [Streptomyces cylindrosporus]
MTADGPPPPQVRVTLPDGQQVHARLVERRQWPNSGWMYLVALPVWANAKGERVEAREFRVWLTPGEQVHPVEGEDYERVPTHPLPTVEGAPDPNRWAFKTQRIRLPGGRRGGLVVHIWDCPDAPDGGTELDVMEALDVMRTVAGARLCKECGAAVALGPLLPPT